MRKFWLLVTVGMILADTAGACLLFRPRDGSPTGAAERPASFLSKVRRVRPGLTPDEVHATLGNPCRVSPRDGPPEKETYIGPPEYEAHWGSEPMTGCVIRYANGRAIP